MNADINEVRQITTRAGSPMCEVLLLVRKEGFRVTAFKNLAEHLISYAVAGDRLSVDSLSKNRANTGPSWA